MPRQMDGGHSNKSLSDSEQSEGIFHPPIIIIIIIKKNLYDDSFYLQKLQLYLPKPPQTVSNVKIVRKKVIEDTRRGKSLISKKNKLVNQENQ